MKLRSSEKYLLSARNESGAFFDLARQSGSSVCCCIHVLSDMADHREPSDNATNRHRWQTAASLCVVLAPLMETAAEKTASNISVGIS